MFSLNLPDFDALWDYSHPDQTESRFRELLPQFPEDNPATLELLTQIARAQGLQRKFEEAQTTLDRVVVMLEKEGWKEGSRKEESRKEERGKEDENKPVARARIRYLLERGRVFNSSGHPVEARRFFEQAFELAEQTGQDFYAVDALHMLAIVAAPVESLSLNLQAIKYAESSQEERARNWLGSLYNNVGWSHHDTGDYASALEVFEKAEAWQRSKGRVNETRIAKWCVARALRSLNRVEEALSKQMDLLDEFETVGESDGYVFEEIGECLLLLNRAPEARQYFAKAYDTLSGDAWLAAQEPERLARLKKLGKE